MKASDIVVGETYAATNGASRWDRKSDKATKVEVIDAPAKGKVTVKLLEDSQSGFGMPRFYMRQENVEYGKAGMTYRCETRDLWMRWPEIEVRVKNEREAARQRRAEEAATEARLDELQRRADSLRLDTRVSWRGYGRNREAEVAITADAFGKLLDLAEAKP